MTRRLIPLAVMLVVTLVLALLVRDFVREVVVVPVVYASWIIWLTMTNLPDWFFWGLLVLAAGVLAVRSLRGAPRPQRDAVARSEPTHGPVTSWAQRLQDAPKRQTSRWRVARDLGRVFWETHFPEEPFHLQTFQERIDQPELAMPAEIRDYFLAGLARPEPIYRSWFILNRNRPPSPLDLNPAAVVDFLENIDAIGRR